MDNNPALLICSKCKKGVLEMRVKRSLIRKLLCPHMKRYFCYSCKKSLISVNDH